MNQGNKITEDFFDKLDAKSDLEEESDTEDDDDGVCFMSRLQTIKAVISLVLLGRCKRRALSISFKYDL